MSREKRFAVAKLPDGSEQRRETKHAYTWALAIEVAKKGGGGGWLVCQWSKDEAKIRAAARRLSVQWHEQRKVEVVPVEIAIGEVVKVVEKVEVPAGQEPLTDKQWACLAELESAPASVFQYGSTTVHRLRELGLVETSSGTIAITSAGMAKLSTVR